MPGTPGRPRYWLELFLTKKHWPKHACIIWPFSKGSSDKGPGYGHIGRDKNRLVHIEICRRVHGAKPTRKHEVAHSCGNGHLGCINPNHLRWATRSENHQDKKQHGTDHGGERNPRAKLTSRQILKISELGGKITQKEIAERFDVSQAAVSLILSGKHWSGLKRKLTDGLSDHNRVIRNRRISEVKTT